MRRLIVIALCASLLVALVRSGSMRERTRDLVHRRFNPLVVRLGLVGGRRSPWASLEHVGRRTGAMYRTPVLPVVAGEYVYVPLPYGADAQWTKNVQAAGHCRLQRHGSVLELDEPAVVPAAEMLALPAWYRRRFGRRLYPYLRLHVLREWPGTLDATAPPTVADAEVFALA